MCKEKSVAIAAQSWSHMTDDEMIARMNDSDRTVKVLLFARLGDAQGPAEGVWVLIADGDRDAGIGVLLSNVVSLGGNQPGRGDLVEYRTVNPDHKPYVVNWVDGQGN